MLRSILLLLVFQLCLINITTACSCDGMPTDYKFATADVVFLTKIGKNHQLDRKKVISKFDHTPMEIFKGEPSDTIVTGGLCGTNFPPGSEVIIYATIDTVHQRMWTDMCRGNRLATYMMPQYEGEPQRQLPPFVNDHLDLIEAELAALRYLGDYEKDKTLCSLRRKNGFTNVKHYFLKTKPTYFWEQPANVAYLYIEQDLKKGSQQLKFLNSVPEETERALRKKMTELHFNYPDPVGERQKVYYTIVTVLYQEETGKLLRL